MTDRQRPWPILAIHTLAMIGVLFWLSMAVGAFAGNSERRWLILALAVVLGGAHVAISLFTRAHSRTAVAAMWFVFVGDSLLTVFIDWKALALVLFTVGLLLLTRTASARTWFRST